MIQEYYYKVVTCDLKSTLNDMGGVLKSVKRNLVVQYHLRKFVYPRIKHSHLFAFKTIETARNFAYGNTRLIFLVEVKHVYKYPVSVCVSGLPIDLRNIIKRKLQKKKWTHYQKLYSSDTVGVGAIKLINQIK